MSTTNQLGTFEHGTYGYPIYVLLSQAPAATVKLTAVTAIALTLTPPDTVTPRVNQRALDPNVNWTIDPSPTISDTIWWRVAQGDHDVVGRYLFKLEIDSESGTKHLVTTGFYDVV